MALKDPFKALRPFSAGGKSGQIYSVPALEQAGLGKVSRLPVSIRLVLESVLRNCDGVAVTENDVKTLAAWNATSRMIFARSSDAHGGLHRSFHSASRSLTAVASEIA
mgnify:CR=1 FL=1